MCLCMMQYLKIIQNPSTLELQKAANQGRRCTWEKLSAIKANCGIELALDECVAILNHMRRLKRSAERAAAAASSSHGFTSTLRSNGSRRIPSWNCIARENSTGSLEDYLHTDVSSLHQGGGVSTAHTTRNRRTHRNLHEVSDSESESDHLNSWTRSGGPLMRTTSADKFVEFVQSLDTGLRLNRGLTIDPNNVATQTTASRETFSPSPRVTTPDRNSDSEFDQRDFSYRFPTTSSSIMVAEGDLLHAESIQNGIVFNVVKKEDLTPSNRSHDSENNSSVHDPVAECVHIDSPENEMDTSSVSEDGDHDTTVANHGGNTNTHSDKDDGKQISDE